MERSDGELSRHSKEREHRRATVPGRPETSRPPPPFSSLEGKISEGEEKRKNHEIRPAAAMCLCLDSSYTCRLEFIRLFFIAGIWIFVQIFFDVFNNNVMAMSHGFGQWSLVPSTTKI